MDIRCERADFESSELTVSRYSSPLFHKTWTMGMVNRQSHRPKPEPQCPTSCEMHFSLSTIVPVAATRLR